MKGGLGLGLGEAGAAAPTQQAAATVLAGGGASNFNGEMKISFENAPPGMKTTMKQSGNANVKTDVDTGSRSLLSSFLPF